MSHLRPSTTAGVLLHAMQLFGENKAVGVVSLKLHNFPTTMDTIFCTIMLVS